MTDHNSLPDRLEVHLADRQGKPLPVDSILVVIRFFLNGKYYYGDLLGLTDRKGVAYASRADIRARFEANQRQFPMDYRVRLDACDELMELAILEASEIERRKSGLPEMAMVSGEARSQYTRARNTLVLPVSLRFATPAAGLDVHRVTIVTELAKQG